jgi:membrane associated rhomboid family serine protease
MIPLRDDNPTQRPSIVVPVLMALNIAIFLTEPVLHGSLLEQKTYFLCRASIGYEVTHQRTLGDAQAQGSLTDREAQAIGEFQQDGIDGRFGPGCPNKSVWFSILLSMFLHASLLHIGGNMLFLWVFGNNVEDAMGRIRFLVFYLLCGLAATLAQSYAAPDSTTPLIGASGAIAGVLGAYLILYPRAKVKTMVLLAFFITFPTLPAYVVLGLWFVLQIFSGVGAPADAGGVAYMAHIGGFIAGVVLLAVFRRRRQETAPPRWERL